MDEAKLQELLAALGQRKAGRTTAHQDSTAAAVAAERAAAAAAQADLDYTAARQAALSALDELYPADPGTAAPVRTSGQVQTPAPEGARGASGPLPAAAVPQALLGLDPDSVELAVQLVEQVGPAAWPLVQRLLRRLLS